MQYKSPNNVISVTYDHRLRNTGHPVRSALHKSQIGRLVVGWVTTSEYLLLYVFCFCFKRLFGGWGPRVSVLLVLISVCDLACQTASR
jgi:hypothetical protein